MSARVVVGGDLCIGSSIPNVDRSPGTLWSIIGEADLAVANLECVLTDRGVRADKAITLRADPSVVDEVWRIGFRVVTLANNHAMDYGPEGLEQTIDVLDRHGIAHCGTGRNYDEAARPASVQAGDLRIAIVSFASTVPAGSPARKDRPGLAPIRVTTQFIVDGGVNEEQPGSAPYIATHLLESDADSAEAIVRRAREANDFVIVGLHWGVMPLWMPPAQGPLADYQRPLAHRLVDAGADLIVGGHAHVPHGVEVYRGKLIAYSLGNLIFHKLPGAEWDLERPGPRYGAQPIDLDFSATAGYLVEAMVGRHRVEGAAFIPYRLDENANPVRSSADDARAVLKMIQTTCPNPDHFVIDGEVGRVRQGLLQDQ